MTLKRIIFELEEEVRYLEERKRDEFSRGEISAYKMAINMIKESEDYENKISTN